MKNIQNDNLVDQSTGEIIQDVKLETTGELAPLYLALSMAQSEMKSAKKAAYNEVHKSNFADYNAVWEAVIIPLTRNGFAYFMIPNGGPEVFTFKGVIAHESGSTISATIAIKPVGIQTKDGRYIPPNIQTFGSMVTYAKRYLLMSLSGVPTDDDDDGNTASQAKGGGYSPKAAYIPNPAPKGAYKPNPQAAKTAEQAKQQVKPNENAQPKPGPKKQDDTPVPDMVPEWPSDIYMNVDELSAFIDTPLDDEPAKQVVNHAPKPIKNDLNHCTSNPEDYVVNFGTKLKGKRLGDINVIDLTNAMNAIVDRGLDVSDPNARELANFYNLMMSKRFTDTGI